MKQRKSTNTLTSTLAASIRQEHQRVHEAIAEGLLHAREAGRLLTEARQHVKHGAWGRFVEQDCGLSRSTAAGYVRVCERWNELEPYVQRDAHLPLRRALVMLADPRSEVEHSTAHDDLLDHAHALMEQEMHDRARIAELQGTLDRDDATVAELQTVIDDATRLIARATERRVQAEQAAEKSADLIDLSGDALLCGSFHRGKAEYMVFVQPSMDQMFYFYLVVSCDDFFVDGGKRAIHRNYVLLALESSCQVPIKDVAWRSSPVPSDGFWGPWEYNKFLYDSHEDYVQRGVLGGDGFIDSPYVATSPDEHRAFIDRVKAGRA